MNLNVSSEIGRLRRVMVHEPGLEVDYMVPELMQSLLFDDILYGDAARCEHQNYCRALQKFDVTTIDVSDLLKDAVKASTAAKVATLIETISRLENLEPKTSQHLHRCTTDTLAQVLITGLPDTHGRALFQLNPIPNLMFARDPVVVIADRYVSCSMATDARQREALLLQFIFSQHPEFTKHKPLLDLTTTIDRHALPTYGVKPELEGGDVLVLGDGIVAVGWSERTNERAIEALAEAMQAQTDFKHLIMVCLPDRRSVMHLDTVFTRINHDACLVYPPMFFKNGSQRVPAIAFDLQSKKLRGTWHSSFLPLLSSLGMDLKPIACGGEKDMISQQREQWTDGANAFCVAPGILFMYKRNTRSIEALAQEGYRVLSQNDVLDANFQPDFSTKNVILVEGNELSRARGGPRCMTHPLERDDL